MILDASLLNTQHYKVWIKGKVEQSRERSSALPQYLGIVAIEKRAFESPSTTVVQLWINRIWNGINYKGWYAIKPNKPNQPTKQGFDMP